MSATIRVTNALAAISQAGAIDDKDARIDPRSCRDLHEFIDGLRKDRALEDPAVLRGAIKSVLMDHEITDGMRIAECYHLVMCHEKGINP